MFSLGMISFRHIQRTSAEHDKVFQIMSKFSDFMALDHRSDLLRRAIESAHLEMCEDNRQPSLSSQDFFLIFVHF